MSPRCRCRRGTSLGESVPVDLGAGINAESYSWWFNSNAWWLVPSDLWSADPIFEGRKWDGASPEGMTIACTVRISGVAWLSTGSYDGLEEDEAWQPILYGEDEEVWCIVRAAELLSPGRERVVCPRCTDQEWRVEMSFASSVASVTIGQAIGAVWQPCPEHADAELTFNGEAFSWLRDEWPDPRSRKES